MEPPRQIIFLSPLGSRAGHVGTRPFQPLLRGGRHKTLNTPETLKYFPSGNTEEIQSVGAVTVINITSNNRIINLRWKKKKAARESEIRTEIANDPSVKSLNMHFLLLTAECDSSI